MGSERMKIVCPKCGEEIKVSGLGRRSLNIPLKNVCESLQAHKNVVAAANELNCSQGYIFGVLKTNGLKAKDVIGGKVTLSDTKQKECIL